MKVTKVLLLLFTATLLYQASAQDKEESEAEELPDRLAGEKLLAAQVNAIAVLNMIRALEEEMQVRYMVMTKDIVKTKHNIVLDLTQKLVCTDSHPIISLS